MTTSPSFGLPDPQASAGQPSTDFEARLIALVDAEMDRLTNAHALDEWHVDYLDPRITAQIDAEHTRIDAAAHGRRAYLAAQQRTLLGRLDQLKAERASAAVEVRTAQAELDRRVSEIAPLAGIEITEGTGTTTAAAILRVMESTAPATALDSRREGATESERRADLQTQEHLLDQHERRVAAQHRAVDRAREIREAAELRFRHRHLGSGAAAVSASDDDAPPPPALVASHDHDSAGPRGSRAAA